MRRCIALLALMAMTACTRVMPVAPAIGEVSVSGVTAGRFLNVVLRFTVPRRVGNGAAHYISASTKSVVFVVSANETPVPGGSGYANIGPSSSQCRQAPSGLTCTVPIPVRIEATGTYTFALATFDAPQSGSTTDAPCTPPETTGCAGKALSQNVAPATLTSGTANVLSFTLGGVPARIVVAPVSPGYLQGGSGTSGFALTLYGSQRQNFTVQAYDAGGNAIVGAGAPRYGAASDSADLSVAPLSALSNEFAMTAAASGSPPAVSPGVVRLTVTAAPPPSSGVPPLSETGTVRVAHRALFVSTANGRGTVLVFYEGNTTPSVKLFFGKAGESTQGVAIGGSPQMAYVAGMGKIFACEPDVKIAAECSIAARDLQRVIYGLAIDSSEALYVADPLAGNVLKCPSGSLPRHCSVKVSFFPEMSPHGLAIGTGDALYIANSLQSTVQRCTFPTQNRTICTVQTVPSYPYGIAAAPNNQFAVSSLTLDGVFLCSTAFCFLEIFGLRQPEGVAIDAAGTTIVADSGNRRLLACAPSRPAQPPRCSVVPIRKPLMPTFLAAIPTL